VVLVFIAVTGRPDQATTKRLMLTVMSNVPSKMARVLSILARGSLPAILSKNIVSIPSYSNTRAASRVTNRAFFESFISPQLSTVQRNPGPGSSAFL
jgi:hypothetical protein